MASRLFAQSHQKHRPMLVSTRCMAKLPAGKSKARHRLIASSSQWRKEGIGNGNRAVIHRHAKGTLQVYPASESRECLAPALASNPPLYVSSCRHQSGVPTPSDSAAAWDGSDLGLLVWMRWCAVPQGRQARFLIPSWPPRFRKGEQMVGKEKATTTKRPLKHLFFGRFTAQEASAAMFLLHKPTFWWSSKGRRRY